MTSTIRKAGQQIVRKRFDSGLFQANDHVARQRAMYYLHTQGIIAEENPDQYGIDLLCSPPGSRTVHYGVEVEVKRVWKGAVFPWLTVQLPERKLHYLHDVPFPVEYWIFNAELTHVIVIHEHSLGTAPVVVVPNKFVPAGEKFAQVLISDCDIIELPNGMEVSNGN